ncbi:penicillin-binding protein PBP2X [Streptococcus caprae]|uniref:Penicillin-binding protein PBP2X n=1 Tax=Streptococcus caprae TaxID=1640501 RepID=A0ABV8CW17_9STRE
MKLFFQRLLAFIVRDRKSPEENRVHVGQNLLLLTIGLFVVFVVNFAIIIGRDDKFGVDLSEKAKQVYQTNTVVQATRGTIYDRNGYPIAEDSTTYSIYAVIDDSYVSVSGDVLYVQPSQYDTVAQIFHDNLGMETDFVLNQLKKDAYQVEFGNQGTGISYSTMTTIKDALAAAGIQGIAFTTNPSRMYPNGMFASEFIGMTSAVSDDENNVTIEGTSGLEAAFNDILSGTDGLITYKKDSRGNVLLGTGNVVREAVDGKDIYTTLSATLQTRLETQMNIFQEETGGVYASATVVNAKTGEILATTQRPSFNADTMEGLDAEGYTYQSQLYETMYEPGSTMKVFTLASAIDSGNFNPNQTYFNDKLEVYDVTIRDWDVNSGDSDGQYMSLAQGFAHSSNIGMVMLEQIMGNDLWLKYLSEFKFGTRTRIGMINESVGQVTSDNAANIAQSAFGQGISVTQLQMLRAFTAISNNGVMLEPQIVSQIYDVNTGTTRAASSEIVGNPISADAASQTRNYMVTVGTDPYFGTLYSSSVGGPVIQVGGYSVAMKSGTAQIAKDGVYLDGEYLYSVIAMVPADEPEFLMYVTLQQPEHFSIVNWQEIFNPILEEAMQMKDTLLAPATVTASTETPYTMPEVIGKKTGDTTDTLRQNIVQPILLGLGEKIVKSSVAEGENLASNQQVLLLTDDFSTLPDMYGWTKENVETFAQWMGIEISYEGSLTGTVIGQDKDDGTAMSDVKSLTITLEEDISD